MNVLLSKAMITSQLWQNVKMWLTTTSIFYNRPECESTIAVALICKSETILRGNYNFSYFFPFCRSPEWYRICNKYHLC